MLQTIILDDNEQDSKNLSNLIQEYSYNFDIKYFTDIEMCKNYIKNHEIHVLFLDIEVNGTKSFSIIDELDKDVLIIFVTNYPSYALDCFGYRTLSFVEKDKIHEKIPAILREIEDLRVYQLKAFNYKKHGIDLIIPLQHILYIQREYNHIKFTYFDNHIKLEEFSVIDTLENIEKNLTEHFIKIDRGTFINYYYIKSIEENCFVMADNKKCYVSRRHKKEAHARYTILSVSNKAKTKGSLNR